MIGYLKFILRLLIGISLLVVVAKFSGIKLTDIWQAARQIDFFVATITVVPLLIADRLLMSYKWNLLLRATGIEISLWRNFKLYMTSSFVGLALPSTIGADLVRTYKLSVSDFRPEEVFASVIIERLLGFGAVIGCVLVAAPILGILFPDLRALSLIVLATAAGLVILFIGTLWGGLAKTIRGVMPHVIGHKLTFAVSRVYRAYRVYGEHRDVLILFFALSILETSISIVVVMLLGHLMGINVPWFTYLLMVPLVLFVIRVPVTINGIGLIEVSYVFLFTGVGMSATDAFSLGLIADAAGILMGLFGGVILLVEMITNPSANKSERKSTLPPST